MVQRRFDAPERQSLTSRDVKRRDAAGSRCAVHVSRADGLLRTVCAGMVGCHLCYADSQSRERSDAWCLLAAIVAWPSRTGRVLVWAIVTQRVYVVDVTKRQGQHQHLFVAWIACDVRAVRGRSKRAGTAARSSFSGTAIKGATQRR